VSGRVSVVDAAGKVRARVKVSRTGVLPGASVDLPAKVRAKLTTGRYTLRAALTDGHHHRFSAHGTMELFGTNTVRDDSATLTAFRAPDALKGKDIKIHAAFRNTGNVPGAPRATLDLQDADGRTLRRIPLRASTARPGTTGTIDGTLPLPHGTHFGLTLHLATGAREVDSRSVTLTVRSRPSLASRLSAFFRDNVPLVLAAAFALLLAGATVLIRYIARLRRLVKSGIS
jgi:hypothetical protein